MPTSKLMHSKTSAVAFASVAGSVELLDYPNRGGDRMKLLNQYPQVLSKCFISGLGEKSGEG